VVNNHGDRKSPKWGYSPSKWPKWRINTGDPNHLLNGMILQVSQGLKPQAAFFNVSEVMCIQVKPLNLSSTPKFGKKTCW